MLRTLEIVFLVGMFVCAWFVSPWLTGVLLCFGGLVVADRFDR